MAPKKRKAAAAGVGTNQAKEHVERRVAITTLQQDEAEEGKASIRRPQRRNLDDKIERALGLHFSHLPRVVREEKRVEGLTLRARMAQDMAECERHGGRLGARYWQEMQQLYASSVDPTSVLQATDKNEPIAEALIAALEHFDAPNPCLRTAEPLLAWLQTNPTVNQRELIGLLKASSKDSVRGKASSDNVLLSLLKFIARKNLQEQFPEEVKSILPMVDPIMVRHFMTFKRSGVSVDTYLQCHLDVVCLLLDRSDLEAVLANEKGWKAVEPQLCRLSQSTQLGRALFTKSMVELEASSFSCTVAGALELLMGNISSDTIEKYKKTCMEAAAACKDKVTKAGKKIVKVSLCGHTLEIIATSTTHESQLHLHAVLKQAALQSKQLEPLIYEDLTIEPQWLACGQQLAPSDSIQDYTTARTLIAEMLDDRNLNGAADQAECEQHHGSAQAKAKVLAILPTATPPSPGGACEGQGLGDPADCNSAEKHQASQATRPRSIKQAKLLGWRRM